MTTDIAIIGLSVEVPDAPDQHAFWDIVRSGRSLTRPFPPRRRRELEDYLRYYWESALVPDTEDGVSFHDGSFLDRVDLFDHAFFGMTPKQAAVTDPHQRLVLRTMYRALEDAGYTGDRLAGSRTGVYVGYAGNPGMTYAEYFSRVDPALGQLGITGNIVTMLANRLSYLFDLRGPSMVIDSACSASLLALHQARSALILGDCEMAVVAGTRIVLAPVKHPHTRIGIESSDGVTRTFDESADGTGFGEGSGVVVLKRLDRALADGDQVYAVVKGSAVNHDGRSEMMTAPDARAQSELLQDAWQNAEVDPRTIGYLEVHGTATRVGDPIEFEGLRRAFATRTDDRRFCAVGTVKANIGHLFEGSGVMGVIKAALALRHRVIPPLANYARPNNAIDLNDGPVYVPREAEHWPEGSGPRRAGVSAFGLGGTNAHVVLEEFVPEESGPETSAGGEDLPAYLFTLSAQSPASLGRLVTRYRQAIDEGRITGDIRDVCRTSNLSRAGHRHRLAYQVADLAALRTALAATEAGEVPDAATGAARDWAEGADVDLLAQYAGQRARTVHLPPYEFDETRAWIDFPETWRDRFALAAPRVEHPVTHEAGFAPAPLAEPDGSPTRVLALVSPAAAHTVAAALPPDAVLRTPGGEEADLERLAEEVLDEGYTHLVYASAFDAEPAADPAELDRRLDQHLIGLFLLAKALMEAGAAIELVVLTRRALAVAPGEAGVVAENAALAGLAKGIAREFPYLTVRLLDIDDAVPAALLGDEILAPQAGVYALRGTDKYGEFFAELPEIPAVRDEYLRPGGAYLITGGLGGIGLETARHFAAAAPGLHLYLLGRTALPPQSEWDAVAADPKHPAAARVTAVREISALGATVHPVAADVGDEAELAAVLDGIRAAHGRVDGIVHTAGVPGENLIVYRDTAKFASVLRPKLRGAFLLHHLTRADRPDFVLHMSSVAAVFPALGQADYAAANVYLDHLARTLDTPEHRVVTVQWVAWREVGMAVATGANDDLAFRSLRTRVGVGLIDAALRGDRAGFFAGEVNYDSELMSVLPTYHVRLTGDIQDKIDKGMAALTQRTDQKHARLREAVESTEVHLTGGTDGTYTDRERMVGRCLAHALGYPTIDVHADFRDMGADSIMAMTIGNNVSACLGRPFDTLDLMSERTVAAVARLIETKYDTDAPDDDAWLDDLLAVPGD
ncbi:SDR family NAD(P)-dependent oxidoreductase [Streptomyces sp. NPDC048106]|uniref:type I polyketide synthase n=1 Tax=Streptomyces sp. NPDC048106 TaxID=3155750 RepID=UPI0034514761